MKKTEVVKDNRVFNSIIDNGLKIRNKYFVVYYNKVIDTNHLKFGIAVGKKVGNAVIRNKYKRKIRSIVDANKLLFKKGYNYIIIVRKECLELNYQTLNDSLMELIEKVN